MTGCFNIIIDKTVSAFAGVCCITLFGTGGSAYDFFVIMSGCRNNFLRNENLAANGAMFSFRKSRFGTGRFNSRIDYLFVAKSRNYVLFYENLAASFAMFAFGEARFGAGRSDSFVDNLGMTGCFGIIRIEFIMAFRTTIGCKSTFGAGGFSNLRAEAVTAVFNSSFFVRISAEKEFRKGFRN